MTCKHAIIIAAGFGSRRLPVTKAIEKEMMPFLDRPVIDYVVQDCIDAGVEHIVFVTGEGSTQIESYYSRNAALEQYLTNQGKMEKYGDKIAVPDVKFDYVVQTNDLLFNKYGTNTAVALARPYIPEGDSTVVLYGDAFVRGKGVNAVAELVKNTGEGESGALSIEVNLDEVSKYGVLDVDEGGYMRRMVEKPTPEEAPSRMINAGEYVFTSELLDEAVIFDREDYPSDKERYVNIEPMDRYLAKGGKMKVIVTDGTWLDAGSTEGWLRANLHLADEEGINYR